MFSYQFCEVSNLRTPFLQNTSGRLLPKFQFQIIVLLITVLFSVCFCFFVVLWRVKVGQERWVHSSLQKHPEELIWSSFPSSLLYLQYRHYVLSQLLALDQIYVLFYCLDSCCPGFSSSFQNCLYRKLLQEKICRKLGLMMISFPFPHLPFWFSLLENISNYHKIWPM